MSINLEKKDIAPLRVNNCVVLKGDGDVVSFCFVINNLRKKVLIKNYY
jgi:hypothetical protein